MSKYYKKRYERIKILLTEAKKSQGKCANCDMSDIRCFEFDHTSSEPKKNKGKGILELMNYNCVKNELTKGNFLCVNCHRLKTKNERIIKEFNWKTVEADTTEACKNCNGKCCNGKLRPLTEFHKNSHTRSGYYSLCKVCVSFRDYIKLENRRSYVDEIKLKIEICEKKVLKNNTCCFDFDHIDRKSKINGISNMVKGHASISKIDNEISKCRLLCGNCHRIYTHKQLGYTM